MNRNLILSCVLLASGCADRSAGPGPAPTADAGAGGTAATDAWLGRWNGPEGTFLLLEKADGDRYSVTVQDLDGPRVFRGTAVGDRIEFDRDGVTESVRPTDGAATGMKWLAEKAKCLTIRYGEGYCRD